MALYTSSPFGGGTGSANMIDTIQWSLGGMEDLLAEAAPDAVIIEGQGFGHASRNLALPIGARCTLDTDDGRLEWSV